MEEEAVLDVGIKYPDWEKRLVMVSGLGRGGFFAGAIGGLMLAFLLVGLASQLPTHNGELQQATPVTYSATATTTAALSALAGASVSTTTPSPPVPPPVAQIAGVSAPVSNSTPPPSTTTATTVVTSTSPTLSMAAGKASVTFGAAASTAPQAQRPDSLARLPGESFEGLLATVSPLLVGLLVAALVYGAYTRRQDAS